MNENYLIEPFINKKIILEKSENIEINILKPIFEKDVLDTNFKNEGKGNGYYSIMKLEENKIRLYYRGGYDSNLSRDSYSTECTCYCESSDGLEFVRTDNHVLFQNGCSHNFFPFKFNNQFYGIGGTTLSIGGLKLLKFDKEWKIEKNFISDKDILPTPHGNNYDSLNLVIYNPNDNLYWVYLRHNLKVGRSVQYSTTKDLKNFTDFKRININLYDGQIYAMNVCSYPNSKILIAFPTIHFQENNYYKKSSFGYSTNGSDWEILDSNICNIKNSHMMCQGIIESKELNKIFCYPFFMKEGVLKCYSWDFHRIQEIKCEDLGKIKFGPYKFEKNKKIKINCRTIFDGFIKINLISNNNLITTSKKIRGNLYFNDIIWNYNIEFDENLEYNLEFELYKSSLYSILFE